MEFFSQDALGDSKEIPQQSLLPFGVPWEGGSEFNNPTNIALGEWAT